MVPEHTCVIYSLAFTSFAFKNKSFNHSKEIQSHFYWSLSPDKVEKTKWGKPLRKKHIYSLNILLLLWGGQGEKIWEMKEYPTAAGCRYCIIPGQHLLLLTAVCCSFSQLCPGSCCKSEALWLLLTAGTLLRMCCLMLEFLTCLRIKFCNSQLPLLEFLARPVSTVGLHIYSGVAVVYFHITLVVWSNQAQISPEFHSSLPLPALPALTHPSPDSLPLSTGGKTLTSVSHLFHTTRSPSINNPLKWPLDSCQRFILSLLQPYSSGLNS